MTAGGIFSVCGNIIPFYARMKEALKSITSDFRASTDHSPMDSSLHLSSFCPCSCTFQFSRTRFLANHCGVIALSCLKVRKELDIDPYDLLLSFQIQLCTHLVLWCPVLFCSSVSFCYHPSGCCIRLLVRCRFYLPNVSIGHLKIFASAIITL